MFLAGHKKFFFGLMIIPLFLIVGQFCLAASEDEAHNKPLYGLDETAKQGFEKNITESADLSETIGKMVGAGLSFLGIAFFVLMIYGGYTWMFSMGNEQDSSKAKSIIIAAVIGLLVVLAAYAITSYVGGIFSA